MITTGTINMLRFSDFSILFDNRFFIESRLFGVCCGAVFFIIQLAKIGTSVCDNRNEAIIANPTARESGMNIDLGTPDINKAGTNTERILSSINSFGTAISLHASHIALDLDLPNSK